MGGGGFGHALEACSKNFLSTSEWSDGNGAGVWVGAVRGGGVGGVGGEGGGGGVHALEACSKNFLSTSLPVSGAMGTVRGCG